MAESAVVTFEGGVGLGSMIRQRCAPRPAVRGRTVGRAWGRWPGWPGWLACPLVPPLLCRPDRPVAAGPRDGPGPWFRPCRRLALLASAWAIGEAVGTLLVPGPPRTRAEVVRRAADRRRRAERVDSGPPASLPASDAPRPAAILPA